MTYKKSSLTKQIILFLVLAATFGACTKESNNPVEEAVISDQEMTAILEGALASATQGLIADVDDAVHLGQLHSEKSLTGICGEQSDSTISRSINRPLLTADYSLSWNWVVNCNGNNIPSSINFKRSLTGQYESQRLLSDDQANGTWLLDGLLLSPVYKFSGNYTREGTQSSKVRDQNSFSSKLTITVSEILIDKSTQQISSGGATFELVGNSTNGQSFNFDGDIAFPGNGTATVTVNGTTYTIDLN